MGEQNRRAVDGEGVPSDGAPPRVVPNAGSDSPPDPSALTALPPDADERQTMRQAPDSASPGEGGEEEGIG